MNGKGGENRIRWNGIGWNIIGWKRKREKEKDKIS